MPCVNLMTSKQCVKMTDQWLLQFLNGQFSFCVWAIVGYYTKEDHGNQEGNKSDKGTPRRLIPSPSLTYMYAYPN